MVEPPDLGCGSMPGTIQSIERAAAILRLLGSAGRPLALAEVAAPLDLARAHRARHPAHAARGRVRRPGPRHRPLRARRRACAGSASGWDRHELRSRAMNWADSLAGSAGQEVLLGMPAGIGRSSWCTTSSGPTARRSGCGRASSSRCTPPRSASACSPSRRSPCRRPHELDLQRYTGRTVVAVGMLDRAPRDAPAPRLGGRLGEHRTGVGGLAAPVRTGGRAGRGGAGRRGAGRRAVQRRRDAGAAAGGAAARTRHGRSRSGWGRPDEGGTVTERVVAAIDQGTTSTRCLLFNPAGRMVAVAQREHRQHYPRSGWVEHDAEEIWRNVTRIVPAALRSAGLGPENIVALGIANQRETTVIWDRHTGAPLARAITWQDTRTDGHRRPARRRRDAPRWSRSGAACRRPPTSPGRGCAGCSTTCRGRGPAPRRATCCSGRWRAG